MTGVAALFDQWVTDIIHIRMNPGTSDGFFKLYRNNSLVVNQTGLDFGKAGGNPYSKHGSYVFPGGTGANTYNDFTGGSPSYSSVLLDLPGSGIIEDTGYTQEQVRDHADFHAPVS